ncbi:outer mitochondrial transmembrane helix translocase [Neocloeon triangulifer]|uniref:outer mitochondrial transmembrane helix translocase n=1 Tax=Neocloeon triangulifer TaxID=2078957 RepID=UPI00286EE46B|nr:outer mitochondrial transmembrane helix translocase [Neocloeon triangulifer]
MESEITRTEIIKITAKLVLLSAFSYYSMKWLINQLDPTNKQKNQAKAKATDLMKKIGIQVKRQLSEHELMIATHLVDPKDIKVSWSDIAGLDDVIEEIQETVIFPITRKDLLAESRLSQPPKGVLLHGPPGCGKTLIAKATAKEAGARFINLDVSILTDKWYGESQKLAAAVFSLAIELQPCIIFIDEIDSFLRVRSSQDHEATAMMKAQFMSLWDGLITDPNCVVIVMGATNRPRDLDQAIQRRMPSMFHVGLPNRKQRLQILKLILDNEPIGEDVDLENIAKITESFSGSDLHELCRSASVYRMRDFMRSTTRNRTAVINGSSQEGDEAMRSINMDDLRKSFSKIRESKVRSNNGLVASSSDMD